MNPLTDWEEELRTRFDENEAVWGVRRGNGGYSGGSSGRFGAVTQSGGIQVRKESVPGNFMPKAQLEKRDFTPDSPSKVTVGQTIEHDRFGIGVVISLEGDIASRKAIVDFKNGGRKTLLLKFAKIRIVAQ